MRPIPPPKGEVGGTHTRSSTRCSPRCRIGASATEEPGSRGKGRGRAQALGDACRGRGTAPASARRGRLGALVLGLTLHATNALRSVELETVDARYAIRGEHAVPNDLAIVAMDDRTFSDLGVQYPFPRSLHGQVIDRLRRAGARLIVYDIEFRGRSTPREDRASLDALIQRVP